MHLYDRETSQQIDQKLIELGNSQELLIMRAANAIFDYFFLNSVKTIWCVAGPGNNGSDATAVACLARMKSKKVNLVQLGTDYQAASSLLSNLTRALGVEIYKNIPPYNEIKKGDLIIDGILGTGANRVPESEISNAIDWINQAKGKAQIISIDIPSGINCSSGEIFSKAVQADKTVMCLTPKQGCYTSSAPDFTGSLNFANLGFKSPEKLVPGSSRLLTTDAIKMVERPKTSYKNSLGKVLVLGGWENMEGAAALVARSAIKSGAGKVYLCGANVKERTPEIIGVLRNLEDYYKILHTVDCVIAGPGLGENADQYLEATWEAKVPLVLDADGLRWLRKKNPKKRRSTLIATPHTGEAEILLGSTIKNRFEALNKLCATYGGQWVLKGAGTLIGPNPIFVNPFANSILSTAGSGDVLAGIIGGLVASREKDPALLGVWLHSEAARILLESGEPRIAASEIISKLGKAISRLNTKKS